MKLSRVAADPAAQRSFATLRMTEELNSYARHPVGRPSMNACKPGRSALVEDGAHDIGAVGDDAVAEEASDALIKAVQVDGRQVEERA